MGTGARKNGYAVATMGERVTRGVSQTRVLFQVGVFVGALLLFLVEPMVAKELLPVFGGSAAVWITCLVFFQAALFVGYGYAHVLASGRWLATHWALLAGTVVCAGVWAGRAGSGAGLGGLAAGHPVASIFLRLALWIGLPFCLLASTSPLLQVWLARVGAGGVAYSLFGLSNLASLIALFAYPSLIEPHVTLRVQRVAWFVGVAVFAGISASLAWRMRGFRVLEDGKADVAPRTPGWKKLLWLVLPMIAAMQLSAVTEHLTANVAAIPLLWILPLATYLITFIVAFQPRRWVPRMPMLGMLAVLLLALGNFLTKPDKMVPIGLSVGLFLAELLFAGLACHTELYLLRPGRADEATEFYLMIAAGGALGAFLVGMVAPEVFRSNYDLSIAFALTAAAMLAVSWQEGSKPRLLWGAATVVLLGLCFQLHGVYARDELVAVRNFYGSLRVQKGVTPDGMDERKLMHGMVIHGTQIFAPGLMKVPTTYYAPDSGVGLVLGACCGGRPRKIGVIGLGAGTLAAYGRAGDRMRFYEINPAVLPVAQNLFTYLRDSAATLSFVEGDARASLAAEQPQGFDVLVIDAFSGDAIPLHLLTLQAMAVYRRHLAPGGVLAFHVSNQYVNLEPELGALARATGMQARSVVTDGNESRGEFRARWVLLTERGAILAEPEFAGAHSLESRAGVRAWTDDSSSLVQLLRW